MRTFDIDKTKIINACDRIIELCFYALVVSITFSTSLVEIASSVMIAAWFVRVIAGAGRDFLKPVPVKILLLYFAWIVLSCLNSKYPGESFRGVFKVAEYSMLFLITATSVRGGGTARRFTGVLAVSSFIICIDGFVQYHLGFDLIRHRELILMDYMHRISSSFIHPNDFGVYLLIVSIFFISLLSMKNRPGRNAAYLSLTVVALLGLFLTKSRGAWLSFAAAFLVLGAMKARKILALFIAILIVVFFMLPYTAQERVFNLTDLKSGTTWERLMLWKGTINMIKEHPWLGFGINTYSRNFPRYRPPDYPDVRYTHNSYLHMASEVGVTGALLFLMFLISVFIFCFKRCLELRSVEGGGLRKDIVSGLFAGLAGFSMNCIVDTHLYSVNLAVFFHILLGYCFALCCHVDEKETR